MKNRWEGICYRCGGTVAAGEGEVEVIDVPGRRWPELGFGIRSTTVVEHLDCREKHRGTNVHHRYAPAPSPDDDFEVIERA